jgi:hypothetical protein
MRIAFVTSSAHGAVDPDLPLLLDAARERDVDAEIAVWDDAETDWISYDAVVVRSCWDYVPRRDEFLAWAASVPNLHNSLAVLRWNTDKTYLRQLEAAGVPIIETRWSTADEARAHSAELVAAGRHSMTQPYISSVDDEGETAMLYFAGKFSHAIRKGPMLERDEGVVQDRDSRESITPREPTAAQRELSEHVIATTTSVLDLPSAPLFTRIDLVTGDDGAPLLIELELTEPSLFLPQSGGGADRLVDAILRA